MNLWRAEYNGKRCTVREVTEDLGETVVTNDGNVHARKGDFVAQDLSKAPPGYRSRHIERVIRKNDDRLTLVEQLQSDDTVEDTPEFLEDDED